MKQHGTLQKFSLVTGIMALAVLSCSGLSNVSNLFATATPTATLTFTPSPTLTPTPTFTATITPSASPTPLPTGVKTEDQPDGSTLFTDYDNQYQLILPKGWIVLPLSSKDMANILQKAAEDNPELKDIANNFKNLDPDVVRVMSFNKNSKYSIKGFTTDMIVTAIDNKTLSAMPLDFVTGALEESVKQQGGEVLSTGSPVVTNPNGVEVGSFELKQTTPTATGAKVPIQVKSLVFQAGGKLIIVQVGTPVQFAKEILPVLDQIQDSIQVMEP
jgi:hypothetical protein